MAPNSQGSLKKESKFEPDIDPDLDHRNVSNPKSCLIIKRERDFDNDDCEWSKKKKNIKEIYFDGQFYDVTKWIDRHPGGRRLLSFYTEIGEDATIAIQQFHFRSMPKVMGIIKSLPRPPNQRKFENGTQERLERHLALTQDFEKLQIELKVEGFFEPSLIHLTYRILEILIILMVSVWLVMVGDESGSMVTKSIGILLVALYGGRCGWIQHEGGHSSLTGNKKIDNFIQTLAFGLGLGLSSSWWRNQHNRHHAMPQRMHRDVDLDTLPLVAFNQKVLRTIGTNSSNKIEKFFIKNQMLLFLTVDTMLVALFWRFYLHPRHSIRGRKYLEIFCILIHVLFFVLTIGFWPYMFATWSGSIYLFGNFSLSHTHLPVTEDKLHWIEYGLCHTQDIESKWFPWLVDWWMGYLNFQIEHHLFPTMPEYRNRQVKSRVKKLALKYNIPYQCTSYWEAVQKTFHNLSNVAESI